MWRDQGVRTIGPRGEDLAQSSAAAPGMMFNVLSDSVATAAETQRGSNRDDAPNDVRINTSCLICTTPRSGSWLLADQLLRTGVSGRPEEYFRLDWYEEFLRTGSLRYRHMKSHRRPSANAGHAPSGIQYNKKSQAPSFANFISSVKRLATTRNGVLSLKIHWRQLAQVLPSIRSSINDFASSDASVIERLFPNTHYVLLRRTEKIRQAISLHRALQTGVWWSLSDDELKLDQLPEPDLDEVHRLAELLTKQEESWHKFFNATERPRLELTYEDVSADPAAAAGKVLEFLGVRQGRANMKAEPRLRRQADTRTDVAADRYWLLKRSGRLKTITVDARGPSQSGELRTTTLVAENFFEDSAALREYALTLNYYEPYGFVDCANGERQPIWMASRFKRFDECPLKSSRQLISHLEALTGEEVDIDYWRADFPVDAAGMPSTDHRLHARRGSLWNCCFHCKPDTAEPVGAAIHNHVEDSWNEVGPNGWVGVVYLNAVSKEPQGSGLNIWRNRDPARNADWMTPAREWQLVDSIGGITNRLILFRGNLPHSGSPGWGHSLESGRLCLTFYFRTLGRPQSPAVELDL